MIFAADSAWSLPRIPTGLGSQQKSTVFLTTPLFEKTHIHFEHRICKLYSVNTYEIKRDS